MAENHPDKNLQNNPSVLITGGSGLIGKYLTSLLLAKGFKVSHLSRKASHFGKVRVFRWDPEKEILDPAVFDGINYIVHLAGANIGEKRWSEKRKVLINSSRVGSSRLLYKIISENNFPVKAFISASAAGYYGSVTCEKIFSENDPPATDFLGSVCSQWEEPAEQFKENGIRSVIIRTAVVLEKTDSALSKLMMPGKYGFLVQAGSGRQYMPWIHINDLCNIYLKAISDSEMNGAYNAVSPQHVTHSEFMKTLAHVMKGKFIFPPVPGFILKTVLGEMSDVILKGSRVSSEKVRNSGYTFRYDNLKEALQNVIYG